MGDQSKEMVKVDLSTLAQGSGFSFALLQGGGEGGKGFFDLITLGLNAAGHLGLRFLHLLAQNWAKLGIDLSDGIAQGCVYAASDLLSLTSLFKLLALLVCLAVKQ